MSKIDVDNINKSWNKKIEEMGIYDYMVYSPFSDEYWNQQKKIVICNLETFGYDDCGVINVNIDQFAQWFRATNITKTCRYSIVFIYGLLLKLQHNYVDINILKQKYKEEDELLSVLPKITYMNIRKHSNPNINQDIQGIIHESILYKDELCAFIDALTPDILLIGGRVGAYVLGEVLSSTIPFNSNIQIGNTLVCSVRHFSRFNYSYYLDKINEIGNLILNSDH